MLLFDDLNRTCVANIAATRLDYSGMRKRGIWGADVVQDVDAFRYFWLVEDLPACVRCCADAEEGAAIA